MKKNLYRTLLLIAIAIALILGMMDRSIMIWAELIFYPGFFVLAFMDHRESLRRKANTAVDQSTREIGLILFGLFTIVQTIINIHSLITQRAHP